jgi:hypothetical protein
MTVHTTNSKSVVREDVGVQTSRPHPIIDEFR